MPNVTNIFLFIKTYYYLINLFATKLISIIERALMISHPLQNVASILIFPDSNLTFLHQPLLDQLTSCFLNKYSLSITGANLLQFKRMFLSADNKQYIKNVFFYLVHQFSSKIKNKKQHLQKQLRSKYVHIFQCIKEDKSNISNALLICDVRVVYQMYNVLIKQYCSQQSYVKIEKQYIYEGIKKIIKLQLQVDMSLLSIELMVNRLFTKKKRSLSCLNDSNNQIIKKSQFARFLPNPKKSLPEIKTRAKSLNLLRKDIFQQKQKIPYKIKINHPDPSPSSILNINLKSIAVKKHHISKDLKVSTRRLKTQSTNVISQKSQPYYRLKTQVPEILKYKKIQLYNQVREMAANAQHQYQYESPIKILANNSTAMKSLNQIFKNNRLKSQQKKRQNHIGSKLQKDFGKIQVLNIKQKQIKIVCQDERIEKDQEEVFQEELRKGKYKSKLKHYKNQFKCMFGQQ